MHVHIFLNGQLILPWPRHGSPQRGGCRKAGPIRYVHTGRWFDVAVFHA